MTKEMSIDEMIALAGEIEDQTQEVSGGDFDNRPPAGVTVGRLISYIELGKHDGGMYNGKQKPDANKVRIEFELLGPDNIIKFEKDGKEVEVGQTVAITLKKSLSDRASFKKLFKKLSYGREDKKHIAQMLGEAFIITVYHNAVKKDGKDILYVNLHKDGEFGIMAPFQLDPITKKKSFYDIRPATQPLRLLLWDRPQQSMWDSLFIDGTREIKHEDGTVEKVSKNWLQEMILSAKNYTGSPLQALLNGVSNLPANEEQAKEQTVTKEVPAVQAEQKQEVHTDKPKQEETVTNSAPVDPLAALGLKMI